MNNFITKKEQDAISRRLSKALRHDPKSLNITLDESGWTDVGNLINQIQIQVSSTIDRSVLEQVVAENDKKRFSFNEDKTKIRANQGHSIGIELNLAPTQPPEILYHGTGYNTLASILTQGLKPMNRDHIHLSATMQTAKQVGSRHGKPRILMIRSGELFRAGQVFYQSDNGVWLTTQQIIPDYIELVE